VNQIGLLFILIGKSDAISLPKVQVLVGPPYIIKPLVLGLFV